MASRLTTPEASVQRDGARTLRTRGGGFIAARIGRFTRASGKASRHGHKPSHFFSEQEAAKAAQGSVAQVTDEEPNANVTLAEHTPETAIAATPAAESAAEPAAGPSVDPVEEEWDNSKVTVETATPAAAEGVEHNDDNLVQQSFRAVAEHIEHIVAEHVGMLQPLLAPQAESERRRSDGSGDSERRSDGEPRSDRPPAGPPPLPVVEMTEAEPSLCLAAGQVVLMRDGAASQIGVVTDECRIALPFADARGDVALTIESCSQVVLPWRPEQGRGYAALGRDVHALPQAIELTRRLCAELNPSTVTGADVRAACGRNFFVVADRSLQAAMESAVAEIAEIEPLRAELERTIAERERASEESNASQSPLADASSELGRHKREYEQVEAEHALAVERQEGAKAEKEAADKAKKELEKKVKEAEKEVKEAEKEVKACEQRAQKATADSSGEGGGEGVEDAAAAKATAAAVKATAAAVKARDAAAAAEASARAALTKAVEVVSAKEKMKKEAAQEVKLCEQRRTEVADEKNAAATKAKDAAALEASARAALVKAARAVKEVEADPKWGSQTARITEQLEALRAVVAGLQPEAIAVSGLIESGMRGARTYATGQWLTVRQRAGESWVDMEAGADGAVRVGGRPIRLHPWNHAPRQLPYAAFEALCAWYLDTMRDQHSTVVDAASGARRDALELCVATADAAGGAAAPSSDASPLFGDAHSLSAWLAGQYADRAKGWSCDAPCAALLTAPPAAGKTTLLSQLVALSLAAAERELVPIVIKVPHLERRLLLDPEAFSKAWNYVDAYLRLEHPPPLYRFLRQVMASRRALLLIDGLDEGGQKRDEIEAHVADVLAPQGHVMLCTSRHTGIDLAGRFGGFHALALAPLADAQQVQALTQRLGLARAAELLLYVRDRLPAGTATGEEVTASPLMLSMVASVFEQRADALLPMPATLAELYSLGTEAVLARGGVVPPCLLELVQRVFFDAHVGQKRLFGERELLEAALSIEAPHVLQVPCHEIENPIRPKSARHEPPIEPTVPYCCPPPSTEPAIASPTEPPQLIQLSLAIASPTEPPQPAPEAPTGTRDYLCV